MNILKDSRVDFYNRKSVVELWEIYMSNCNKKYDEYLTENDFSVRELKFERLIMNGSNDIVKNLRTNTTEMLYDKEYVNIWFTKAEALENVKQIVDTHNASVALRIQKEKEEIDDLKTTNYNYWEVGDVIFNKETKERYVILDIDMYGDENWNQTNIGIINVSVFLEKYFNNGGSIDNNDLTILVYDRFNDEKEYDNNCIDAEYGDYVFSRENYDIKTSVRKVITIK